LATFNIKPNSILTACMPLSSLRAEKGGS